jgi:hypothetical protein
MTFTATSHPAKCLGGVIYNQCRISFIRKPEYIYYISYKYGAHCLLSIVSRKEKVSFDITAFTTMGLILSHRSIVSQPSAHASDELIMKVDRLNTMNRCVS